jgi:hypothetical protein
MPYRFLCTMLCLFSLTLTVRAEKPLSDFHRIEIATTKTSIYIGNVTMTMPTFVRDGDAYRSTYHAKVFPYFFSSEKGTISINATDDMLRRLERGEVVEFTGQGRNTDGEERHIEGRAMPTDAITGKIKVRVFVSKRIQLIFNTTYRFSP